MSNSDDYKSKLTEIKAIKEPKTPGMPVDVFLQEAEDLYQWCKEDLKALYGIGIDPALIKDLPVRAGACREAQSLWNKERNIQEDASKEWRQKSPEAFAFRDQLLRDFRYACRKDEELSSKVKAIAEGDTNSDMIQDLNDLAIFGKEIVEELKKTRFDMSKLARAAAQAYEMGELLAKSNGERKSENYAKTIRDQAYTLLKDAVDEVCDGGKYLFWDDKNKLKGYTSNYIKQNY